MGKLQMREYPPTTCKEFSVIVFSDFLSSFMNELVGDNWGDSNLHPKNIVVEMLPIMFWMLAVYQIYKIVIPAFKKMDLCAVMKQYAESHSGEEMIRKCHEVPEGQWFSKPLNEEGVGEEEQKILDDRFNPIKSIQRLAQKRIIDFQSVRNVTLTVTLLVSYFALKRLSDIKITFISEIISAGGLGRLVAYCFDDLSQESVLDLPSLSQIKRYSWEDERHLRRKTKAELEEFENDFRTQNLYVGRLTVGLVLVLELSPIIVLLSHDWEWFDLMSDKGSSNIALKLALATIGLVFFEILVQAIEYLAMFVNDVKIRNTLKKYCFGGNGITRGLPDEFGIVACIGNPLSYLQQMRVFLWSTPYNPCASTLCSCMVLQLKIFPRGYCKADRQELLYAFLKTIVVTTMNNNTGRVTLYPSVITNLLTISYDPGFYQKFDVKPFFELFFTNLKQAFTETKRIKSISAVVENAEKKLGATGSKTKNFWVEVEDETTIYCVEFAGGKYGDFDLTLFDEDPNVYTRILLSDDCIVIKTTNLRIFEDENHNRHGNKKRHQLSRRHLKRDDKEELEIKKSDEDEDEEEGVKREMMSYAPVVQSSVESREEADLDGNGGKGPKKKTRGLADPGFTLFQNLSLLKGKSPVITSWGVNGCVKVSGEARIWTHTSADETKFAALEKDQIFDQVFFIESHSGVNYFGVFVNLIEYDLEKVKKAIAAHQDNRGCVSSNQRSTGVFSTIQNGEHSYRIKPSDKSNDRFYPKYEVKNELGDSLLIFRNAGKCHNDRRYDTSRVNKKRVINQGEKQPLDTAVSRIELSG